MLLPGVLAGTFIPKNTDGVEDFTDAYAQHVGESMMRALYSELKDLLEGVMWMTEVCYVDVAVPSDKRRKNKIHAVFDGSRVFRVKKLTELEGASEVFLDALFPELYDDVHELLKRGSKVYLLKNPAMLRKLRIENNMKKSDESDAMLLSRISKEAFRLLMIEELEIKMRMRPLIREYEKIVRWEKTLKKLINQGFDYSFKEAVRLMDSERQKISRSSYLWGVYRKACEILRIKKSVELAILVVELPLHLPTVRLKGPLGLIPSGNKGRYDHELRRHIANFAITLYMNAKRGEASQIK